VFILQTTDQCTNPVIQERDDLVFSVTELPLTKAGFAGSGNVMTESVESIIVTVDIVGRSDESACVHKRPT